MAVDIAIVSALWLSPVVGVMLLCAMLFSVVGNVVTIFLQSMSAVAPVIRGLAVCIWRGRAGISVATLLALLFAIFVAFTPMPARQTVLMTGHPAPCASVIPAAPEVQPSPRMGYGGEDDESIRFMEMEFCEPVEPRPADEPLTEATAQWLRDVEEEKRLIEELPFVKGDVKFFYSETSANLNKVEVALWCCWSGSSFKRVKESCDEKEKPTHLEAARALRLKLIADHGQAGHPTNDRAAERRAA